MFTSTKVFAVLLMMLVIQGCSQFQQQQIPPAIPEAEPPGGSGGAVGPNLEEMRRIAEKIYTNETGGAKDKLVHWNVREDFASLGIGHFTWYPAGRAQRFGNSFPSLIQFMGQRGAQAPAWVQLAVTRGAPWYSREQLLRQKSSAQVRQLQDYLWDTRALQGEYIVARAKKAMPRLVNGSPQNLRMHVANNINAVANSPGGWYPLVDYVNFKGEGLNRSGGYNGQNWGLLQVLELMQPSGVGSQALNNFSTAAYKVLERRVRNSPPQNDEAKWLPGWRNRTETYRRPLI
ncbi:MAG: Unknown protein [uncultured Thiotrichaceae bacterium]|uniref:Transglycosylase SLT domain-containing protein n=1 Tax=uncultured Thiotrichaceae bacterium TaxID=298394 RepID=A0A6S6TL05_9GAMM|nr:MAG: Unknown protein [uncultured Thiotrichaceae bacterium]